MEEKGVFFRVFEPKKKEGARLDGIICEELSYANGEIHLIESLQRANKDIYFIEILLWVSWKNLWCQ